MRRQIRFVYLYCYVRSLNDFAVSVFVIDKNLPFSFTAAGAVINRTPIYLMLASECD